MHGRRRGNPYQRARVGDWASHLQTKEVAAMNLNTRRTVKQTVKARDEKTATILVEEEILESRGRRSPSTG